MAEHEMSTADLGMTGPLLLLGAPGVGKGTQAKRLMDRFAVPQISTGDLLRQQQKDGTALGLESKRLIDAGQLVPDEVVNRMVAERLREPDVERGYILDGFPRTLAQADWLDGELASMAAAWPLVAIEIRVPESELLRRITGRRTCPVCGRIYNVYSHPPKVEGRCDAEGAVLLQRSDDTEEAFRRRMVEFRTKTESVIEHYRGYGRFAVTSGEGALDEVEARLVAALRELRAGNKVER